MDKIFTNMDRDKDGKLTLDEFVEGCKLYPTIMEVGIVVRNSDSMCPLTMRFLDLTLVRQSCITNGRG